MAWVVLALGVVAFALIPLRWYHGRRVMALRQEFAEFAGWRKLSVRLSQEVWECPRCSLPCYSWKAVEQHQDPKLSACSWLEEHAEALEALLARVAALERDDAQVPLLDEYARDGIPWTAVTEPGEDDTPALEDPCPAATDDPPQAAGQAAPDDAGTLLFREKYRHLMSGRRDG